MQLKHEILKKLWRIIKHKKYYPIIYFIKLLYINRLKKLFRIYIFVDLFYVRRIKCLGMLNQKINPWKCKNVKMFIFA